MQSLIIQKKIILFKNLVKSISKKVIKQLTQEVIGLQNLKNLFQRLFPSVSWFREHNKFLDSYSFLILFFAIIRLVTIPFAS